MDPFYAGGAAEVAFFLILSLVPTSILLAQFLHVFSMSVSAITDLLREYLSEDVAEVILPFFNYRPSGPISAVLFVLALWAGSKALFSLMRMSNYAYAGGSGYRNSIFGYIRERARALVTIVLVLVTLIFALNILVFGEVIVRIVLRYLNDFLGQDYTFSGAWYTIRWIIALALYFFMVVSIYYMLPNRKSTFSRLIVKGFFRTLRNIMRHWWANNRAVFRMILPGSVFSAIGMLAVTWLYSFYIRYVTTSNRNFDILYGGLSALALLLIWFYIIAFVLIIGIQLNAAWAEARTAAAKAQEKNSADKRVKNSRGKSERRDAKTQEPTP